MTPDTYDECLCRAIVPEHSVAFMSAMSGGTPLLERDFLFFHTGDWLMAIGYPLLPEPSAVMPDLAGYTARVSTEEFDSALRACLERTGAAHCFAIAPDLPGRLRQYRVDKDSYYLLSADAAVPQALRGPVARAAERLTVTEDRKFTPAHRKLWAEFLGRVTMRPNVQALYARTEAALAASRASMSGNGNATGSSADAHKLDLRLLSAFDREGHLAAALLLDYTPKNFCSYIIGTHSKRHYQPHATDLLFAEMLERSRKEGKKCIHLGLGVNEGITRFKKKWNGLPLLPYAMAAWEESVRGPVAAPTTAKESETALLARAILLSPGDITKQQMFDALPQQRPFGMVFSVRKGGAQSWLCGSAHFFRYSFEFAFRDLFARLHTAVFEGPLDEDFLGRVEKSGRSPAASEPRIIDAMSEPELRRLELAVYGKKSPLRRFLGMEVPAKVDVRHLLAHTCPWFAFFSLWVAYLERHGWYESVDLEAWRTAKDMGKAVIAMENLEEQLASLQSVPIDRISNFFRRCDEWPAYMKRNIRTYLNGDLQGMMGSSVEFPSRTEMVISHRDERFRQRMRPFLETGDCAVFVGTAHLLGLIPMLRKDGFTVEPHYPTLRLKFRAALRRRAGNMNA